ncbi:MAG TPA: inositol monophosphatase family protein [Bacteroidia bacterium]
MQLPLDKIRRQVCVLAEQTGKFIQQQRGKITSSQVETKSINSFVTFVDKGSERKLVKGLKKILPEAGFITEEETIANERKKYTWIIDPLDGTTNFIHGVPCYCISIALYFSPSGRTRRMTSEGEVILGVIYEPNRSEMFYATKYGGAFLNGKRISVTKRKKLKDSLLVTGFPTYDYSHMDEYIKLFRHLMKHTRGLRRLGSAAVDLAYTACGRFDAFYEYSLNPWDVAAGALIVEEAGGKITDFTGGNNFLFGKEIIASNNFTHRELVKSVKKFFR